MKSLFLNDAEKNLLELIIKNMEKEFGQNYKFTPKENEFSCKCSGPAQSCTWH